MLEGFSRHQFVQRGRNVNAFGAKAWQRTNQDIDFIFERDGHAYGIEVKNALGYMDKDEFDSKSDLCFELDLIPVFVVRMVPRTWLEELRKLGGFVLVIKFQLYPKLLGPLASRMRDGLGLPVDTPATLWEGTMERFLKWHHAPSGDGDS